VSGGSGGVVLHPLTKIQVVSNRARSPCAVWPPSGGALGSQAADQPFSLGAATAAAFYLRDSTTYEVITLGGVA
jgi:hypothetical protein